MRRLLAAVIAVATVLVPTPAAGAACWAAPVTAPIADPFREPACRWCSGNRGIEYATPEGTPIRAVAAGTVTFSGVVVDTGYVVVELPDRRRVTYGNLGERFVARGDTVVTGQLLGRTAGRFHFAVRVGDRYVDPARWIGVARYRIRLLPLDGTPPVAPPAPTWACPG